MGIVSTGLGWILGLVLGFVLGKNYAKTGKIQSLDRISQKIEGIGRKRVVYVEQMTPQQRQEMKDKEGGWAKFYKGIKPPAKEDEL